MLLGFSLVFLAALAGGALGVPLKRRKRFELENIYIPSTLVMMLLLPFSMAALVLPQGLGAVRAAGPTVIWEGVAFGFGWGVGAVLFGYGITMSGMSVGFAVIMGINTAVGSILPFVAKSRHELFTPGGFLILMGISGCVVGVAICGRAGSMRETQAAVPENRRSFGVGIAICALSGVLSSCANLGFTFAARASDEAIRLGSLPVFSTLASWLPVFWGASASLLLWFGSLQIHRGTWRKNIGDGALHDWSMGILMGCLWFVATIPYGMGAHYLGRLGTSVGWAVNIASSLLVANILGFVSNEWTGASIRARRTLYSGLGVLISSIALLAFGSSLSLS